MFICPSLIDEKIIYSIFLPRPSSLFIQKKGTDIHTCLMFKLCMEEVKLSFAHIELCFMFLLHNLKIR